MEQTATARIERGETRRGETKQKLLETAERLFALHGIDAVSLRQITQAASQRNESALQYHFGSRDGLIEAIFAWRMAGIDRRRNALLDALEAAGRQDDVRALVAGVARPLSDEFRDPAGANHYNRFLAKVQRSPSVALGSMVGGKYDRGAQRIYELLARRLRHLPERLLRQRFVMVVSSLIYGLADIESVTAQRREQGRDFDVERAIENLTDMAAAAIAAPVSPETQSRLDPEDNERIAGATPS